MQINSACSSHSNISMKPLSAVIELLFAARFSSFTFPISLRLSCTHNTVELSHLRATQQVPRLVSRFRVSVACDGKRPLGEEFLMIANLVCLDHLVAGVSEVLSEARIETSFVQTFFSPHHKAQIREKLFLAQNSREFNT